MRLTIVFLMLFSTLSFAGDPRYCEGPIPRDADGKIKRSAAAIREFKSWHPCPVNPLPSESCPRWRIDHIIPLSEGGCDVPWNMQWLPVEIKTCAGKFCKDRWERKVYARPTQ